MCNRQTDMKFNLSFISGVKYHLLICLCTCVYLNFTVIQDCDIGII